MKTLRIITTSILLIPLFVLNSNQLQTATALSDNDPGDYHYLAIQGLSDAGIVQGNSEGRFNSRDKINRAEALKLMLLSSGEYSEDDIDTEFKNAEEMPFLDTPLDQWYTKYAYFAKEKGIISGYTDGYFMPNESINLAETLKIYLEARNNVIYPALDGNLYADVPSDSWYANYFAYASTRQALDIPLENLAYPNQAMTRGYMAEVMYRMQKFGEGYRFGKATYYGAAVHGSNTASGERFDKNEFTAAHKSLPFGTIIEVTNLANGKTVQVKVIDRGPYGAGRILDLSSGAFAEIASLGAGVVNVQARVIQ
jgi:rare lipoprotein A